MSDLVTLPPEPSAPRSIQPRRADWSPAGILSQARQFTAQPAFAKAMPAIAVASLIGMSALAWSAFSQPPQRDLFAGLADGDKAVVADALRSAGVDYTLDNKSGALSVSEADYHEARMLLASQGLPKGAPDSESMISNMPMGASRAVEDQRLRAAREADLARTIEEMDAVKSARVHLAVEQPSVFLRDRSAPAASVMLQLQNGRSLSDGQVHAMAYLVASSVPGLSPEGVSVVDQTGRLLSRNGDASSAASDRQIDIQQRMEKRYVESLNALLTPMLGAGNFTTEVHADVDFAEVQATRESYPQDTSAVREERGAWTKDGEPVGASGIPGAISNQAPTASQVQAAPGASLTLPVAGAPVPPTPARTTENYNRTFELGREVSVTKQPVGSIKRLSVAVALRDPATGKPRSKAEIAAVDALVKGAVGFDQARGDQIAISSRKFADVTEEAVPWWQQDWIAMVARNVTALLVVILLVFGIGRPMLKRRAAAGQAPGAGKASKAALGGEIASALADRARTGNDSEVTIDMIEAAPGYTARADLIRNFVRQDPARAALVVRDLIQADSRSNARGD
ncbi:flagellar basal-body MS-ring/collar protein FliF [Sphingobium boeckii]|uniref:Flagellar M-ring protein n=1 Tax=Sphingobium boeckii TaxID=1082345 RepID=A0A7W9AJ56_9SPHN|nr:flagellar basal-body MS-ring/collar protein FliF [Sphingobium boeckii]MBB5686454.1 flagellar M-ring protein FliF [Sphingobium boeckii]